MIVRIYSLNDPISNEVRYIGRTTKKLNQRLREHICDSASNHNTYKKNWIRKLKKLNKKPIIASIRELDCSWEESHIVEISIIKEHFEKGCKLVNLVDKGCGSYGIKIQRKYMWKPILQYDLDGNFIKEWESMTIASAELNIGTRLIFKALNGISIQSNGFMWKYKILENYDLKIDSYKHLKGSKRRKKVIQYDIYGNFIKIHESYRAAADFIEIKSESNISEAVNKKYIIKGFQWRNYEDGYSQKINKYKINYSSVGKKVIAIDEHKNKLHFKSQMEAATAMSVSSPTISNWCKANAFKRNLKWYFN